MLLFGFGTNCRLFSLCPLPSRHSNLDWRASRRLKRQFRDIRPVFISHSSTFLCICGTWIYRMLPALHAHLPCTTLLNSEECALLEEREWERERERERVTLSFKWNSAKCTSVTLQSQLQGWVIWENSYGLRSALSTISSMSKSLCVTLRRKAFRDMAPILCLSLTVSWPAKASNAYKILDMIRPVNNACSAWTLNLCNFSCDNKYRLWCICISILFTIYIYGVGESGAEDITVCQCKQHFNCSLRAINHTYK